MDNGALLLPACEQSLLHQRLSTQQSSSQTPSRRGATAKGATACALALRASVASALSLAPFAWRLARCASVSGRVSELNVSWLCQIMEAANRVLPLRGWPARALFLDCSFKWITDDGLQEMLPKGSEIHMWHLPFLRDGMELVVSDGKGDGLSCVKQYYDRNGSTRRNRYKVFQVRHSEHWSVAYWRIFVRFYRYRIALLHRYRTASLTLHADHFRPGRQPPQTPDPRPA